MPGRPLSPLGFHWRSHSHEAPPPSFDDIIFPKSWEDAWGGAVGEGGEKSDLERARVFLFNMAITKLDSVTGDKIQAIVTDRQHHTVPALAAAVRTKVFLDRVESFATNPLMQCIRFMLLKAHVTDTLCSERTREVMDFFFDPTLERNVNPLPTGDVVVYKYPAGRLKVAIVGGGPTALASAISLAEKGAGKVEVHMFERRWVRKEGPNGTTYVDYPPTARRRDQVVTLQDTVTSLLTKASYQALFAGRPERVWPGSANIQIRKVEDRFLKRVQDPEFKDIIHLHTEAVTREDLAKVGDFHVLLGADGAASWVRKSYFQGYEHERGKSYALGLAFDRPTGLPWSQPLNMFLTLGQTRYLLNASDYDGRGYLNMQLTEEEWHKMLSVDGQPVQFGRPGCLRRADGSIPDGFEPGQVFAPFEDRTTPLCVAISDGLKLFGFKEEEVINVVRIPIVVQAVTEGVHQLPAQDSISIRRPHALVAVAGDAAMTVHFWPGRGLNSGIKSGIALGDELVHALNHGQFIGMPLTALKEYNNFILKLQGREHDKRSIPILNQSGTPEMLGWLLDKAHSVPDQVAIEWLVGAMTQIAERLEQREDWAYERIATTVEPQIRIVLRQLNSMTLREMAVSFPWPTREMAGAEVLPVRSMKPEEKQKWLQHLWGMLHEKGKDSSSHHRHTSRTLSPPLSPPLSLFDTSNDRRARSPSTSIFEAPPIHKSNNRSRPPSPLPSPPISASPPSPGHHSNGGSDLCVPGMMDKLAISPRSPSPSGGHSAGEGEVSIGRMLSVHKKPPSHMLGDALSLALFRVQEAT